jgi:hypothetical protein
MYTNPMIQRAVLVSTGFPVSDEPDHCSGKQDTQSRGLHLRLQGPQLRH